MEDRNYPGALDILIENHYAYVDRAEDEMTGDRLEWVEEFNLEEFFFNFQNGETDA